MTSIEVPDWVARIADEAGEEFAKTHTMSMYSSLADMKLDCVRHMITAALGAWVVPVGVAEVKKLSERTSSYDIAPRDWSFYLSDGNHTIFTLRQEKPE
jgi:hypothetical protein